ncbi:transposase [Streptomyces sp. HC307]|uniref:transposase n=1 Tax=Streptomyces flavusporus TaxID=3385496 RepID=UPI003917467A
MTDDDLSAFTGLRPPQFRGLVDRMWAVRPDRQRGRAWKLSFADRVLLITTAYRTNLTDRQLGPLFGISKSAVDRVLHDLAPVLAGLLEEPSADQRELWVVDGTLIAVHDHTRTAKSKNYRRSSNVQIVARAKDRRVVAVGKAWPGNRNDSLVFREPLSQELPEHRRLSGDGGYRGSDIIRTPDRGPDGKIIRDAKYKRFSKRRAVTEHTIARLKDWQILRQCRRRGDGIDYTVRGVAVLHNLEVEMQVSALQDIS